jgi:hypothetical protein
VKTQNKELLKYEIELEKGKMKERREERRTGVRKGRKRSN